jgi:hypothetical protein
MDAGGSRQAPVEASSAPSAARALHVRGPMRSIVLCFAALASLVVSACGGQTVGIDPFGPSSPGTRSSSDAGSGSDPTPGADGGPATPVTTDAGIKVPTVADASTGVSCTTSADCSGGAQCAWPVTEDVCIAFNPAGTCVMPHESPCQLEESETGCGCDGTDVQWTTGCVGLPTGWAPVGIAHYGSCADAGTDAGQTVCQSDGDCLSPAGMPALLCGFPVHGGCGATGTCVPEMSVTGDCNMVPMPACACDGTRVLIECGATFTTKPVAHRGACDGDGGL